MAPEVKAFATGYAQLPNRSHKKRARYCSLLGPQLATAQQALGPIIATKHAGAGWQQHSKLWDPGIRDYQYSHYGSVHTYGVQRTFLQKYSHIRMQGRTRTAERTEYPCPDWPSKQPSMQGPNTNLNLKQSDHKVYPQST